MKIPWKIPKKCCLCKQRDENTLCIPDYGVYNEEMVYYHEKCLERISSDPEQYGHNQIDLALHITELIEQHNKQLEEVQNDRKKKDELLKKYSSRIPWWELEKFKP